MYDPVLENSFNSATVIEVTSADIQHDHVKAVSIVIKRRNEKIQVPKFISIVLDEI